MGRVQIASYTCTHDAYGILRVRQGKEMHLIKLPRGNLALILVKNDARINHDLRKVLNVFLKG